MNAGMEENPVHKELQTHFGISAGLEEPIESQELPEAVIRGILKRKGASIDQAVDWVLQGYPRQLEFGFDQAAMAERVASILRATRWGRDSMSVKNIRGLYEFGQMLSLAIGRRLAKEQHRYDLSELRSLGEKEVSIVSLLLDETDTMLYQHGVSVGLALAHQDLADAISLVAEGDLPSARRKIPRFQSSINDLCQRLNGILMHPSLPPQRRDRVQSVYDEAVTLREEAEMALRDPQGQLAWARAWVRDALRTAFPAPVTLNSEGVRFRRLEGKELSIQVEIDDSDEAHAVLRVWVSILMLRAVDGTNPAILHSVSVWPPFIIESAGRLPQLLFLRRLRWAKLPIERGIDYTIRVVDEEAFDALLGTSPDRLAGLEEDGVQVAEQKEVVADILVDEATPLPQGVEIAGHEILLGELRDGSFKEIKEKVLWRTVDVDIEKAKGNLENFVVEEGVHRIAVLDSVLVTQDQAEAILPKGHAPVFLIDFETAKELTPAAIATILKLQLPTNQLYTLELRQDELGTHLTIYA